MPNLSALASIPGYGGYIEKRRLNEQQGMQELQQYGTLMQLQANMQAQQKSAKEDQRTEKKT